MKKNTLFLTTIIFLINYNVYGSEPFSSLGKDNVLNAFSKYKTNNECVECHDDVMANELKHMPAAESCVSCHQSTGAEHPSEEKGFAFPEKVPGLCYVCHSQQDTKKHIHYPIADGDCKSCHNPHSAPYKSLLNDDPLNKLCESCHGAQVSNEKENHPPVMDGDCSVCHEVHQSDYPKLLVNKKQELCFSCHDDLKEELNRDNIHYPFDEDCSNCHKAHSSKEKNLLNNKTKDVCYSCHDIESSKKYIHYPVEDGDCMACHFPHSSDNHDMLKAGLSVTLCNECHEPLDIESTSTHMPAKDGKCITCHTPHASNDKKFLVDKEIDLCLSCHNKTTLSKSSKQIVNIKKNLENSEYLHPPIEMDGCTSCHKPHSSIYRSLLVDNLPKGLYASANAENFSLCFDCHDEAVLKSESVMNTGFRNGDQNLHYLHIKGSKGSNCTNCHNVHGSKNVHMIKETMLFGNWEMPIKFQNLENGGSCAPGCHTEYVYIR